MSLYSLTHLTGRKRNADRKIIIATVETSKHGFIVSIVAVIASILPTVIAIAIFGPPAIIVVPVLCVVAALILFKYRSQKGLQLPMYKMLLDKGAAKKLHGQILVCGVPIQRHAVLSTVVHSSLPVKTTGVSDADLFNADADVAPLRDRDPVFSTPSAPADPRTIESRSDLWD
jgi:hypothetical protein